MHLSFENVNDAFAFLVNAFKLGREFPTTAVPSRNGPVVMATEPMTITYRKPYQRVLFNQARDANPFLHLYESLWMLAGRNDVAPLAYYASNFLNYSDDGKTLNGAYGYRWRHAPKRSLYTVNETPLPASVYQILDQEDQLEIVIANLKRDPTSRREVIQMWNVEDDLLKNHPIQHPDKVCSECNGTGTKPGTESTYCKYCSGTGIVKKAYTEREASKDVCCNLSIMVSIRNGEPNLSKRTDLTEKQKTELWGKDIRYLDITVTNRSNDLIWGMLGANVVHFSFLQEYLACRLGVEVGTYNQFSNNLHVYTDKFEADKWLQEYARTMHSPEEIDYNRLQTVRLIKPDEVDRFDEACKIFVDKNVNGEEVTQYDHYGIEFIDIVATPMMNAFHMHKARDYDAASHWVEKIWAVDWRIAARNWINKRATAWKNKNEPGQVTQGADLA